MTAATAAGHSSGHRSARIWRRRGRSPDTISHRTTPRDQTSDFSVTPLPASSSGDDQSNVPSRDMIVASRVRKRARPTSASLALWRRREEERVRKVSGWARAR